MPCAPRLDAPGVLHHVMARGIIRQTMLGVRHDNCDSAGNKSQEPLTFRTCFRRDSLYYSSLPDWISGRLSWGPVCRRRGSRAPIYRWEWSESAPGPEQWIEAESPWMKAILEWIALLFNCRKPWPRIGCQRWQPSKAVHLIVMFG